MHVRKAKELLVPDTFLETELLAFRGLIYAVRVQMLSQGQFTNTFIFMFGPQVSVHLAFLNCLEADSAE
jgi:hypothetical protein